MESSSSHSASSTVTPAVISPPPPPLPPKDFFSVVRSQHSHTSQDKDESTLDDIFYTPYSSPRASLTSSVLPPMVYASPCQVRDPTLRDNEVTLDHPADPSSIKDNNNKPTSSLHSTMKNHRVPSSSPRAPVVTPTPSSRPQPAPKALPSLPPIANRTPSHSNSLGKDRPAAQPPSGPSSRSPGPIGQGQNQAQRRANTTVSMASTSSSMSSNSLDGHSVVFSDLVTDTTRATTASPDSNGGAGGSQNKERTPAVSNAMKRWADKTARDALKATITPVHCYNPPSGSTILPQPRKRSSKAHTYNVLGTTSTIPHANSPDTSTSTNPTSHHQCQYQRNRDNKTSGTMMSMTAVLEAAEEEEELHRKGIKNSAIGSSAWKARQLLKEHKNSGKSLVAEEIIPEVGKRVTVDSKGKGKGKGGGSGSAGRDRNKNGRALDQGKGKEREHISAIYMRHQPLTSSPLAIPAKPFPVPNAAPLPRHDSFSQVPKHLSRPVLGRRRSSSLGSGSVPRYPYFELPPGSRSSASHIKQNIIAPHTGGHLRTYSVSHNHSSSDGLHTSTEMVNSSAHPRSSGELPSKGTPGYTSLVLPRAPPPLNLHGDTTTVRNNNGFGNGGLFSRPGDGKVDLTRDGLAQTTMVSVEVVRGLGGISSKKGLMDRLPLVRRTTISVKATPGTGLSSAGEVKMVGDEHREPAITGLDGATSILGFANHRKPPEYIPNDSVLVQVWAVGVDGVDGKLIGVRLVSEGAAVPPSPAVTTSNSGDGRKSQGFNGLEVEGEPEMQAAKPISQGSGLGRSLSLRERLSRSVSLRRSTRKERHNRECSLDKLQHSTPQRTVASPYSPEKQMPLSSAGTMVMPGIGHVPGRSFVGRVVECGWEVRDEVVRKGDWVAGLLDVKKSGALTEFIVVDRHRIHRVPHPKLSSTTERALSALIFSSGSSTPNFPQHTLTLEDLALLPLCGVPAYRAVRTFIYAFSSMRENPTISSIGCSSEIAKHRPAGHDTNTPLNFITYGAMVSRLNLGDHENGRRRRALVLRGHDGVGAMAAQMLVLRGWRVCVHVPFIASPPNVPTTSAIADAFMEEVEERIRSWGAEEVIFDDGEVVGIDEGRGAVVRVINGLREDGDVFDAILDTIGGKDVREAAERLLRSPGRSINPDENPDSETRNRTAIRGMGQFTTVIGDNPERAIPSAGDLFRAGIRSLKFGNGGTSLSFSPLEKDSSENMNTRTSDNKKGKVGYAWINISQDVDWEGRDVGETIGLLVNLGLEYGIKPWVGAEYAIANDTRSNRTPLLAEPSLSSQDNITAQEMGYNHWEGKRIVPLEKAPDVFVCGGPLTSGGTVIVRVAA